QFTDESVGSLEQTSETKSAEDEQSLRKLLRLRDGVDPFEELGRRLEGRPRLRRLESVAETKKPMEVANHLREVADADRHADLRLASGDKLHPARRGLELGRESEELERHEGLVPRGAGVDRLDRPGLIGNDIADGPGFETELASLSLS